jgi:hypothetical protein
LHIYINGEIKNEAVIFNILRGISLYPAGFLDLKDIIILLISLVEGERGIQNYGPYGLYSIQFNLYLF